VPQTATDPDEKLLVVEVEQNAELVAGRLLAASTRPRHVHVERHPRELAAVVGGRQHVAVRPGVVVERQSVQRPRRPVQLDPRRRRHGMVVRVREKYQLQVAGVAFFRVVESVVRYGEPQHIADSRLPSTTTLLLQQLYS